MADSSSETTTGCVMPRGACLVVALSVENVTSSNSKNEETNNITDVEGVEKLHHPRDQQENTLDLRGLGTGYNKQENLLKGSGNNQEDNLTQLKKEQGMNTYPLKEKSTMEIATKDHSLENTITTMEHKIQSHIYKASTSDLWRSSQKKLMGMV